MAITDERPRARLIFRRLALGMAVLLFVFAGVFFIVPNDVRLAGGLPCLFVGFVMLTIARTGLGHRRDKKRSV